MSEHADPTETHYPGDPDEDDSGDTEDERRYMRQVSECGDSGQGFCTMAGTEFCDFECPFRDEL